MSKYQVHVMTVKPHMAFEKDHSSFEDAVKQLNELAEWQSNEFGEFIDEYTFDDTDTILITAPSGKVVKAWQRYDAVDIASFAKFDRDTLPDVFEGWQIVGHDGFNIHGEDDDPFNLTSYAILVDGAQNIAREWCRTRPDYKVIPVFGGDIEEPEFVSIDNLNPDTIRMIIGTEKSKPGFTIVVIADGDTPYVDSVYSTWEAAKRVFDHMIESKEHLNGDGNLTFVFDHADVLMIAGPDNHFLEVWNRDDPMRAEDFAAFDLFNLPPAVIGWKMVDGQGSLVHGESADPFGLNEKSVLLGTAASDARVWAKETGDVFVAPVFRNAIEEPEFVHEMPSRTLAM